MEKLKRSERTPVIVLEKAEWESVGIGGGVQCRLTYSIPDSGGTFTFWGIAQTQMTAFYDALQRIQRYESSKSRAESAYDAGGESIPD